MGGESTFAKKDPEASSSSFFRDFGGGTQDQGPSSSLRPGSIDRVKKEQEQDVRFQTVYCNNIRKCDYTVCNSDTCRSCSDDGHAYICNTLQ